jgi:glutamyl-tRNA reductase
MKLLVVGCSFRTAPLDIRERLVFGHGQLGDALDAWVARGLEVAILSTCNRVEIYLASPVETTPLDGADVAAFLAEFHRVPLESIKAHLYQHDLQGATRHLFRVASGLDSLVLGEGQIAGQVKQAIEFAQERGSLGPALHALFQHGQQTAKRVRSETGIGRGHVSVSSVAIDYVREVFDHFDDKTVLVIGAGKMAELTLKQLAHLRPHSILVANRSPERAVEVAAKCQGTAIAWDQLDQALIDADIILSTTGAPEPIVSLARYRGIAQKRAGRPVVILDIAVPRDFDPRIHDGDLTCLFNIDDLEKVRRRAFEKRQRHAPAGEAIVDEEVRRFWKDWSRRRNAPVIAQLTLDLEQKRQVIVRQLMQRLDGRLSIEDRNYIEGAFRLLQNQFLHGPLSALAENAHEQSGAGLLDALRKLFRLEN